MKLSLLTNSAKSKFGHRLINTDNNALVLSLFICGHNVLPRPIRELTLIPRPQGVSKSLWLATASLQDTKPERLHGLP